MCEYYVNIEDFGSDCDKMIVQIKVKIFQKALKFSDSDD